MLKGIIGATALLFSTGGGDTNTIVSLSKARVLSATIHLSLFGKEGIHAILTGIKLVKIIFLPSDHYPGEGHVHLIIGSLANEA